jgi:hypothetical protein
LAERGEKGMGFSQTTTTHHFLMKSDGGVIQVEANDSTDTTNRDNIRMHLTQEFLDQLLEVNSSRVQNDVDERVRESRKKLDVEIKEVLREASAIADRALARAPTAQAAGTSAVERAVVRLAVVEREIRGILPSGDRAESLTQRSE